MKKSNLKKLTLKKEVVARLEPAAQAFVTGGGDDRIPTLQFCPSGKEFCIPTVYHYTQFC